jgi:hypothetical protein
MCSTLAFLMATLIGASTAPKFDTAKIEQLTGAKGSLNEKEGVFKVSFPRIDLNVKAAGVHLTPPMGLTAWAAFTKVGGHTAVMGDMVLTEDQVNPAMSAALDNGLTVTALHNHFFWEQPRVMFMHIGGMGDEAKLAAAVGKVFEAMKQQGPVPEASIDPVSTTLDPKKIEAVLSRKGEMASGVKTSLADAVRRAEKANKGYRAISIVPTKKDGHARADVTLLRGAEPKTVTEPLGAG